MMLGGKSQLPTHHYQQICFYSEKSKDYFKKKGLKWNLSQIQIDLKNIDSFEYTDFLHKITEISFKLLIWNNFVEFIRK